MPSTNRRLSARPGRLPVALLHHILRAWFHFSARQVGFTALKWVLLGVLAANYKSLPIFYHLRLSPPIFRKLIQDNWRRLRVFLSPTRVGHRLEDEWLDSLPLLGTNPFEYRDSFSTRATLDECDYNVHLSNSSYAKILDIARIESVVRLFPLVWSCGAGMALGASHFHYLREIPAMQKFEIRSSIATWDHKWLYIVSKFVSHPNTVKTAKINITQQSQTSQRSHSRAMSDGRAPCLTFPELPSPPPSASSSDTLAESLADRSTSSAPSNLFFESDGALVYTVVVSQVCFKASRVTIPPSLILASNGFASPSIERSYPLNFPAYLSTIRSVSPALPSSQTSSPRATAPPDHWGALKAIASPLHGGSMKKLYEFYRGGWRDVPQKDQWWESALDGYVEVHRSAALTELGRLREGLDTARTM